MDKTISDLLMQVGAFGIGIAAVGYLIEKITKVVLMVKDRGNGKTHGQHDIPCGELQEVRRKLDEKEQGLQEQVSRLVESINELKIEFERRMTKMETLIKVYSQKDS
jgi:hypothetical protein